MKLKLLFFCCFSAVCANIFAQEIIDLDEFIYIAHQENPQYRAWQEIIKPTKKIPKKKMPQIIAQQTLAYDSINIFNKNLKATYLNWLTSLEKLKLLQSYQTYFETIIELAEIYVMDEDFQSAEQFQIGRLYGQYKLQIVQAESDLEKAISLVSELIEIKDDTQPKATALYEINAPKPAPENEGWYIRLRSDLNLKYLKINFFTENLLPEAAYLRKSIEREFDFKTINYTRALNDLTTAISHEIGYLQAKLDYNLLAIEIEHLLR